MYVMKVMYLYMMCYLACGAGVLALLEVRREAHLTELTQHTKYTQDEHHIVKENLTSVFEQNDVDVLLRHPRIRSIYGSIYPYLVSACAVARHHHHGVPHELPTHNPPTSGHYILTRVSHIKKVI